MQVFQKVLSLVPVLCFCIAANAQQLGNFDIHRGAAPFLLGSCRVQQDSTFRLTEAGTLSYNGRTEHSFSYPAIGTNPYAVGKTLFKVLVLTYTSDTLRRMMLSTIYTPHIFPDFAKRAKVEFRAISKLLKDWWDSPGSKKTFFLSPDDRIVSTGLEWRSDNMVMKLALYTDKSSMQRLYNISITLEQAGYE